MAITALPTPPSRSMSNDAFVTASDNFVGALPTFGTEANTLADLVNTQQVTASAAAVSATASAVTANAAAVSAAVTATVWISGTFALGDTRYSPTNYLTYRCTVAGARTIDPSLDPTNWALVVNDVRYALTVSTSKPVIRATPVQRRKFIENSDGIGSSSNAFNIPQMQATIAGTRTSGTIFTRTAGTWTVSALVGQYCFSYATGVPATGVWLPITANDATTLTVSGTLNATGTSVMTCPWNPIANTYAHGQGATAYVGACFDGESIWLVPSSSANLTKVNPATGALTHYAHGQGTTAYYGACFDGESIWLVPLSSANITKVNPATGALTHYAHGQGATAYVGACFDGESIWLTPYSSANLTKVNPATGALTHYAHGQGTGAYAGAVFDGESIWLAPSISANLTKVNPATGALTHYAHGQGATAYTGACFDGESIWLVPSSSANLTKVNPATGALTHYAHGQGTTAYAGACFDGESIWLAPRSSANITKVNPATGALTHYAHGQGATAYTGACFDGESIWLTPYSSANITRMIPPRAGRGGSVVRGALKSMSSILSSHATAGIGYDTGAGGAVTQGTSRTTGVTLDKACGAITLFSAAGSAAWQSFTVTCAAVVATDVVSVVQKSGTDLNMIHVTAVAAGSFRISFATTGGVTVEQPVFSYAIQKAVAA